METQKTLNSKNDIEKEWSGGITLSDSDYTPELQQ